MRAFLSRLMAICGILLLSACVLEAPGNGKAKVPNPVTGGEIEVTPLDDPAPAAKPGKAGIKVAAPEAAPPAEKPGTKPKPRPERVTEAAAAPPPPAPEPAAAVPEEEKSAARIACEKKGDLWAKAGNSSAHTCVKRTRDSGKRCTRGTQCEGLCLARSGTCAPFTPLFGCNEILQDDGRRVTLCLD